MLKLSTKGRYGMRAMVELARAVGNGPVLASDIAESQELSLKYLHALLTSLRVAGLVTSVRGAKGGFLLAKPPAEISVSEIIESLEGPVAIVECIHNEVECRHDDKCPTRQIWRDVNKAINGVLTQRTLADLV